jgi:hypothetical protein
MTTPTPDPREAVIQAARSLRDVIQFPQFDRLVRERNILNASEELDSALDAYDTAVAASLPPDLAALLDRHGVPATVDGLLAAFEARGYKVAVSSIVLGRTEIRHEPWHADWYHDQRLSRFRGPTALIALARAFAAMVGEGEG